MRRRLSVLTLLQKRSVLYEYNFFLRKAVVWSAQEGALKKTAVKGPHNAVLVLRSGLFLLQRAEEWKRLSTGMSGVPSNAVLLVTGQWESTTEWRANFFLMNPAAYFIMESDCQRWTRIWSMFWEPQWQDHFCSGQRETIAGSAFCCFIRVEGLVRLISGLCVFFFFNYSLFIDIT